MNPDNILVVAFLVVAGAVCPDALIGAISGALFYAFLPKKLPKSHIVFYTMFSTIFGYSASFLFDPEWRMFVSMVAAALGVTILHAMIRLANEDWIKLLHTLIELYEKLRRKK